MREFPETLKLSLDNFDVNMRTVKRRAGVVPRLSVRYLDDRNPSHLLAVKSELLYWDEGRYIQICRYRW